ncbi:hypothetical protein FMO003_24750 [Moritella sp. F3]|nr:hypothetical protein FMO001_18020 [Moritella sp. F1]GIC82194.1 hypothetical protein FMO003_24750 [Moritella sp. F3]
MFIKMLVGGVNEASGAYRSSYINTVLNCEIVWMPNVIRNGIYEDVN